MKPKKPWYADEVASILEELIDNPGRDVHTIKRLALDIALSVLSRAAEKPDEFASNPLLKSLVIRGIDLATEEPETPTGGGVRIIGIEGLNLDEI